MTLCKSEERVLRLNKRLECTYIALHSKERLKRLMFQLPFPLGLWLLLLLECQAASPSNRPAQENVQNDVEEGEREREREFHQVCHMGTHRVLARCTSVH